MASSLRPDFLISGNCSHCSKVEMKEFHCPAFAGRGCNHYNNLPGLPLHHQLVNRSPCQGCPGTYQPLCPALPVTLNRSSCDCPRCRRNQEDGLERRVPLVHHPLVFPCNSHWSSAVEVQNASLGTAGYVPNPLPSQPCIPGHVGMTTVSQVESVAANPAPSLSYHHHHHYYHYHYHHHPHSRNNIHPYALPVFHQRLRRLPNLHRTSRHSAEEEGLPHGLLSILTPSRVRWEGGLDAEQLENVVNFGEQFGEQKPRGLTKADVENLPSYRITSKDKSINESRCVICLMDFEEKHQVRILPCLHEYHTKCIDKWLKSNRTCPICRKEIKIS